jgi:hypothetical protein
MPMRGELPAVTARPLFARASIARIAWSRVVAVLPDRNLQAVALFSAIGLLLALNMMLRFPEIGAFYATLPMSP